MIRQAAPEALVATYPRTRPELSEAHRRIYLEHYRSNRAGERGLSRVTARLEAWMHRQVAQGAAASLLEIGAGTLNHVPYHPDTAIYDAVEPFRELWEDSPYRSRVRRIYSDIAEVPDDQRYDSVLSVAVLEHLADLPLVAARSALLLHPGGTFRAGFPSEGGLLWGLAWRATTGLEFRLRRGLDYGAIMRHEHLNTAVEILTVLHWFFDSVAVSRFPLPSPQFSFYTAAVARGPRIERCQAYCDGRQRLQTCAP